MERGDEFNLITTCTHTCIHTHTGYIMNKQYEIGDIMNKQYLITLVILDDTTPPPHTHTVY